MLADGVYPIVASGYRTAGKQQELMDEKIESFLAENYSASEAKDEAKKWVNQVGYSEHQTGLAIDITETDYEPWHYRYVGTEDAEKIWQLGVCLKEYVTLQN